MGNQPSGALAVGNHVSTRTCQQLHHPVEYNRTFYSQIQPNGLYPQANYGNKQDENCHISKPFGFVRHSLAQQTKGVEFQRPFQSKQDNKQETTPKRPVADSKNQQSISMVHKKSTVKTLGVKNGKPTVNSRMVGGVNIQNCKNKDSHETKLNQAYTNQSNGPVENGKTTAPFDDTRSSLLDQISFSTNEILKDNKGQDETGTSSATEREVYRHKLAPSS